MSCLPVKLPGAVAKLQLKDANGGQDPDQQKRQVRWEPELLLEDLNGGEDESQQHSKRQVSWEPDESEEKGTRSSNAEAAHASQQSLPLRISQSNLRLQSTQQSQKRDQPGSEPQVGSAQSALEEVAKSFQHEAPQSSQQSLPLQTSPLNPPLRGSQQSQKSVTRVESDEKASSFNLEAPHQPAKCTSRSPLEPTSSK